MRCTACPNIRDFVINIDQFDTGHNGAVVRCGGFNGGGEKTCL